MGMFALGAKHEDANFTAAAIMQLASNKPIHAFNPVNRAALDQFSKRPADLKRCADALVVKRVKNIVGA